VKEALYPKVESLNKQLPLILQTRRAPAPEEDLAFFFSSFSLCRRPSSHLLNFKNIAPVLSNDAFPLPWLPISEWHLLSFTVVFFFSLL